MSDRFRKLRALGLGIFIAGALGVPGFSLLAPGDDNWKQVTRVALLVFGFVGFGIYGYAVYKINRTK